jgi:ABC-type dipeptide/oligopeptide/nickel transport system permease component
MLILVVAALIALFFVSYEINGSLARSLIEGQASPDEMESVNQQVQKDKDLVDQLISSVLSPRP